MNDKKIYLDNAAATKMDERVLEAMKPYFLDIYAVATSEFAYTQGIEAREALEKARAGISKKISAGPEELVFTSGSTEGSNMALKGVAMALGEKKGKHIITSKIEDFPVLNSAKALERLGFHVTYLDVDRYGFIDLEQLKEAITNETILVSIQHANQEIGTIQDINSIGKIAREKGVLFHSDATHSFGRVPLNVQKVPVDLLTLSAHTIHGPKGIGGLFVRKGTTINKWIDGGFQEFDLRAGLENIPGAVGFSRAADLITPEENKLLMILRDKTFESILRYIENVTINGHPAQRTPQNANVTFHFVEGESITLHLDMHGIAVSTGSACFSRSLQGSHVIYAIGGDHERAHGSIRFTFGRFNTIDEVNTTVKRLIDIVGELRRISPLGKNREKIKTGGAL